MLSFDGQEVFKVVLKNPFSVHEDYDEGKMLFIALFP